MNLNDKDLFSIQLHFIPWINTTDTTRLQMASKYAGGQALPHINQNIPYSVPDSIFDIIDVFNNGMFIKYADFNGRVLYKDDELLIIEYDIDDPELRIQIFEIPEYKQLSSKFATRLRYVINTETFKEGDLLFEYAGFKNGIPTIGYPAKVMFGSFHNINHEDAIIISESFAKKLKHYFRHEYIIPVYSNFKLFKNSHNRLLPEINEIYNLEEIIIAYNELQPYELDITKKQDVLSLIQKFTNDRIKTNLKYIAAEVDNIIVKNIEVYNVKSGKNKNPFLYDTKTEEILEEYSERTKNKFEEKIKRITEKIKEPFIVDKIIENYYTVKRAVTNNIPSTTDLHYIIKLEIVSEQQFHEGDKVSTIAGGKGVSAYVIPDNLMPKTSTGETIDLIISIFTVPSRMNMNQIYDFFVSKLIYLANKMIKGEFKFPDQVLNEYDEEYLRYKLPLEILLDLANLFTHKYKDEQIKYLTELYNDTEKLKTEIINTGEELRLIVDHFKEPDSYTLDDIIQIYKKYEKFGINFVDKIIIPNIKEICKRLTNNSNICDEIMQDDINEVELNASWGILTIMNLYKVARYNWNARAIGRYKRISKQPTRGRKLQGGSRLGNDEISMLLSYDSNYLLKEFIYIKSDDHTNKLEFLSQYPIKGTFKLNEDLKEELSSYTQDVIRNLLNVCLVDIKNKKNNK